MTNSITETVTIADAEAGSRLDRVLAGRIATVSRSHLKALILAGQVKIAARTIRDPAAPVKSGDVVTVTLPPPEPAAPKGETIPLNIVYEDEAIIVIDKPKGLVVHPAAGHASGTLVHQPLGHRGCQASRHRPPPRQGHQWPDGGCQDRQGAPRSLQAVRGKNRGTAATRLSRFCLGRTGPPEGHDRGTDRPASPCARQAGRSRKWTLRDHALAGPRELHRDA